MVFVHLTGPLYRDPWIPCLVSLWLLPVDFKTNTKHKCRSSVFTRLCIGRQSPESVDKSQLRTNWDHTWIVEDIKSDHDTSRRKRGGKESEGSSGLKASWQWTRKTGQNSLNLGLLCWNFFSHRCTFLNIKKESVSHGRVEVISGTLYITGSM